MTASTGPSAARGDIRLIEPSPFAADERRLIGRDPRQLSPDDFAHAGAPLMLAKDAIRAKCLDCCSGSAGEVRKCVATSCPLWPFRVTGSLPKALKRAALGDPRTGPSSDIDATV